MIEFILTNFILKKTMIKENFRFILIFFLLFLVIAGGLAYYLVSDSIHYSLINSKDGMDNIFLILRYYKDLILDHIVLIYLSAFLYTIFFYLNSTRLKLVVHIGRAISVVSIWGLLAIILLIFLPEQPNAKPWPANGKIEELLKSNNVLKIQDKLIYYSHFQGNQFQDVLVVSSKHTSPIYGKSVYSEKGTWDKKNNLLILSDLYQIRNGDKESLGFSLFLNMTGPMNLSQSYTKDPIKTVTYQYWPKDWIQANLTSFEKELRGELSKVQNVIYGKTALSSETWYMLIHLLGEILGLIFLFSAIAILISSKSMPLLNGVSSMLGAKLLLLALIYYYPVLEEKLNQFAISQDLGVNAYKIISGLFLVLLAVIFMALAYFKYSKIKYDLGDEY